MILPSYRGGHQGAFWFRIESLSVMFIYIYYSTTSAYAGVTYMLTTVSCN